MKKYLFVVFLLVLISFSYVNAASTTVEGDVYEFRKSSNKLNLYENLSNIKTSLTDENLNALADGSLEGKSVERYTQVLKSPRGARIK